MSSLEHTYYIKLKSHLSVDHGQYVYETFSLFVQKMVLQNSVMSTLIDARLLEMKAMSFWKV